MSGIQRVLCVVLCWSGLAMAQSDANTPNVPTGQLLIKGSHISLLILKRASDNQLERISDPNRIVSLPEGTYSLYEIHLQGKYVSESYRQPGIKNLVIDANTPCTLNAGGPLTPTVDITRKGRQLTLSYKLAGIDHETYRALNTRSNAPTFKVYRASDLIASGTFEYG